MRNRHYANPNPKPIRVVYRLKCNDCAHFYASQTLKFKAFKPSKEWFCSDLLKKESLLPKSLWTFTQQDTHTVSWLIAICRKKAPPTASAAVKFQLQDRFCRFDRPKPVFGKLRSYSALAFVLFWSLFHGLGARLFSPAICLFIHDASAFLVVLALKKVHEWHRNVGK